MNYALPNKMDLTVAYVSARKESRIEWFFDSLRSQVKQEHPKIIIVDHCRAQHCYCIDTSQGNAHVAPKPNVWNGQHRLTKEDWFAMASARNTALCLCETSHIAFCDDLSVLMPGWLDAAYEAVEGNYIGLGAYRKVRNLVVESGVPVSFEQGSDDDRLRLVDKDVSECTGGWCYGCSLVGSVEDFLDVGGWPEMCDGMGFEDCCFGIALQNAGKHLKYDRRMLTLESEELHFAEPPMKKTDKGVSPNDKSHAALRIAQSSKYFPNYYEGGMRALREHVLAGNPFPVIQQPQHDWYDGQPIAEM